MQGPPSAIGRVAAWVPSKHPALRENAPGVSSSSWRSAVPRPQEFGAEDDNGCTRIAFSYANVPIHEQPELTSAQLAGDKPCSNDLGEPWGGHDRQCCRHGRRG